MNFKKFSLQILVETFDESCKEFSLEASYNFCKEIAKTHYENFPIASLFIPKNLRKYFYSVYAFARLADDISDEQQLNLSKEERLTLLEKLSQSIKNIKEQEKINTPILQALKDTIEAKEIPTEPFLKLIKAFTMDLNFQQSQTFEDVFYYCEHSANPIGEIVLRVFNEFNERTSMYSDKICTSLQLVNFWQDLSIDLKHGRCYIPKETLEEYRLTVQDLIEMKKKERIEICLQSIFKKTYELLIEGWQIIYFIRSKRLRMELNAIVLGGLKILKKEKKMGYKLLTKRPKLNIFDVFVNFISSLA